MHLLQAKEIPLTDYPNLLSPIKIGNIEVRNRIVSSAYQTNLGESHRPTDRMIAYHAERARGGVGLIILEGIRAHPTTRPARYNLIAWDRSAIPSYRTLVDAIHEHGAGVFAQLLHLGRAANPMETRLPLWSASEISAPTVFGLNPSVQTHSMTVSEIRELCEWYARGASNMIEAGFDGIEVHAGHGYLIQQFLSPLTNLRSDEYGGNLRNRVRVALEVIDAVRTEIGSDPAFGVRISADELVPGGLTLADTTRIARWLEDTGQIDYVSVSHSTTVPYAHARQVADMSFPPASFVHFAEGIGDALAHLPVFTVCRIIDPALAESIIAEGKADLVCMARAHIAEPHIALKLAEGRAADIRQCIGCNQGCAGRINAGQSVGCLINAEAGRELELGQISAAPCPKTVVVIGGGLAGLEAARVAALRGHRVTLFEQSGRLGGQINTLVRAPHRGEFGKIVDWLTGQLDQLGVQVVLNTAVDTQRVHQEKPDAVIVATGSEPATPYLAGLEDSRIGTLSCDDVLLGRAEGVSVVVLLDEDGHHKSASTAEYLAGAGAVVHLVTRAESAAAEITSVSRTPALERLVAAGVIVHTESWFHEAQGSTVVLEATRGGELAEVTDVNLVVTAVANRRRAGLAEDLVESVEIPVVTVVGDCLAPRRALEALHEGHLAARYL